MADIKTLRFLGADRVFETVDDGEWWCPLSDGCAVHVWRCTRGWRAELRKNNVGAWRTEIYITDQAAIDSLELALMPLAKALVNVGALNPREHGDSRATSTRREVFVLEERGTDSETWELHADCLFTKRERAEKWADWQGTNAAGIESRVVKYVPEDKLDRLREENDDLRNVIASLCEHGIEALGGRLK